MPNSTLTALSAASALSGPELIYGVQSGGDVKITTAQVQTFALGNSFTQFTGPTVSAKTFTLPNASSTLLYSGGALGTPSSGTLTNCTGLPLGGMSNLSANSVLGNNTGSPATPIALTVTQATAMLNAVVGDSGSGGTKGLVPAPASGDTAAGKFLKADGTFATPPSGSPAGSSLTIQYNNASSFGGMSGTSWDDTNRSLTITGATVTASNPILNLTQTWNNGAVAFTGIQLNVTKTASAAASKLVDIQIAGTSVAYIDATGGVFGKAGSSNVPGLSFANDPTYGFWASHNNNIMGLSLGASNDIVFTPDAIRVRNDVGALIFGSGDDAQIRRAAAATIQHGSVDGASPVAQTVQAQSVVAGTTNTAGVDFTFQGSRGTGTGVGGDVVFKTAPAGSTGTAQNTAAEVLRILNTGNVKFTNAANFSANGAVATSITSVGPTGANTTVQEWLTIKNASGTTRYIPCF